MPKQSALLTYEEIEATITHSNPYYQTPIEMTLRAINARLTGAEWSLWGYLQALDPHGDRLKDLPSVADLAKAVGISDRQCHRALNRLKELDLYYWEPVIIRGQNLAGKRVKEIRKEQGKFSDEDKLTTLSSPGQSCHDQDKVVFIETKLSSPGQSCHADPPKGFHSKGSETPQTSSDFKQTVTHPLRQEEGEVKMLMGIRSNRLSFATFEAVMEHIAGAIASLRDKSSAAAPKTQLNPTAPQTDEGVFAGAKTLRRLSKITGLSVESLRTNVGLQKTCERHPQNVEAALDYLDAECKNNFKPGIGFVVVAIREGRSLKNAGGAVFGEWIRKGEELGLVAYTMSEGDDILIGLHAGKTKFDSPQLYSKLKGMSWEDIKL